jgi:hypothetical protein
MVFAANTVPTRVSAQTSDSGITGCHLLSKGAGRASIHHNNPGNDGRNFAGKGTYNNRFMHLIDRSLLANW